MSRPAQKNIASLLGVSQTTVSAVLNNNPAIKVSEATRKRVLEAAAKENYWPNRIANSLRARKTRMIGVIYQPNVLKVSLRKFEFLSDAIEQAGYTPLLYALPAGHNGEEACRLMRDLNVDGVVLLLGTNDEFLQHGYTPYLHGHIPTVAIDGGEDDRMTRFCSDRRQGVELVTRHLLSLGYRSFGILAKESPLGVSSSHAIALIETGEAVLKEAGIRPVVIRYRPTMKADHFDPYHGGRVCMEKLLERKRPPRAVICSSDAWAIAALQVCQERGIRVPEAIALVGFQNDIQGMYCHPPLTSVDPPFQALTQRAVDHLLGLIDGNKTASSGEIHHLPYQLVVRASCGARLAPSAS